MREKQKQLNGARLPDGQDYVPTVSVTTFKLKDKVSITVKDYGMGIPENIVEKIFEPFFTTKPTGKELVWV